MCRNVKFGQNRSNCGGDMVIFRFFKIAAAILDFFKFQAFNGRTAQEGRNVPQCEIWSKTVNRGGDMVIFLFPRLISAIRDWISTIKVKVKVKVKVAFISIIINDKNKLDTVITKNYWLDAKWRDR